MKNQHKTRLLLSLALSGAMLAGVTSCQKDDKEPAKDNPISISGRYAAWNGTAQGEEFAAGAALGLYATQGSGALSGERYVSNVKMTQQSGAFRADGKLLLSKETASTLYAYYPYRSGTLAAGADHMKVSVGQNQSDNDSYLAADFMLGSASVAADHKDEIAMTFNRMFSKVDIELTAAAGMTLDKLAEAAVAIRLNTTADVDFAAKKILSTENPQEIGPNGALKAGGAKLAGLSAIVVPQTIAADAEVLYITIGGEKTPYPAGQQIEMKPGMQYTLTAEVGEQGGEIAVRVSVEETEWTGGLVVDAELDPTDELLKPILDVEGNEYPVVKIGSQYWMASNLKTTKFNDGTPITLMPDKDQWGNNATDKTPAYCYQGNAEENIGTYGLLYNWYAVDTKKLCPDGWHVPTIEEIGMMTDLLGGTDIAGEKLKSTSGWFGINGKENPEYQGSNASGFDGRSGGSREDDGTYWNFKKYGYWWSSSAVNSAQANGFYIYYGRPTVLTTSPQMRTGYSVRCIRYKN